MIFREPCRLHSQMQYPVAYQQTWGRDPGHPTLPSAWNETVSAEPQRHGWLMAKDPGQVFCLFLAGHVRHFCHWWTLKTWSRFGVSKYVRVILQCGSDAPLFARPSWSGWRVQPAPSLPGAAHTLPIGGKNQLRRDSGDATWDGSCLFIVRHQLAAHVFWRPWRAWNRAR